MKFSRWPEGTVCHIDPDRVASVNAVEGETRFCYVTSTKKPPFLAPPTVKLVFRVQGSVEEVKTLLGLKT